MRQIQASEAKTHLPSLLDDVERGETLIITRHGKAIARLVPEVTSRQKDIDQAVADIKEMRKAFGKLSLDDILSARHEGHQY